MPMAAAMTISWSTLNDRRRPAEPCSPKMLPGTMPVRKSNQEPVLSGAAWAAASTELLRPGSVSRPRPMPMPTAISAVIANHSSV